MEQLKQFDQLTDVELIELSNEQIDWYIKLKKAENGVRILAEPTYPTYREVPEPDMTLYCVGQHCFVNQDTAASIAKSINQHVADSFRVDYDYYRGGSQYKYARRDDTRMEDVAIQRVYSKAVYDSIADIIASNKKIEAQYEKLLNEYNEENQKASDLVNHIYDAISAARERLEQFGEYKVRILEYLRLANGNAEVAWNFFDKAYAVDTQVKAKIMESEEYINAVNGY